MLQWFKRYVNMIDKCKSKERDSNLHVYMLELADSTWVQINLTY